MGHRHMQRHAAGQAANLPALVAGDAVGGGRGRASPQPRLRPAAALWARTSPSLPGAGVTITVPAPCIEGALIEHESVVDCAVFGIPDDDWGEQVKAVIELKAGEKGTPALVESILSFCKVRLATYKCPRSIDFIDALPRDPNGKLYKRRLRDPYWAGRDRSI